MVAANTGLDAEYRGKFPADMLANTPSDSLAAKCRVVYTFRFPDHVTSLAHRNGHKCFRIGQRHSNMFLADNQLGLRAGLLDSLHQRGALLMVKCVHLDRLQPCEQRQSRRVAE